MTLAVLIPSMMSTLTIVVFIYFGNSLDMGSALSAKIMFDYIKDPARLLPMIITHYGEYKVAMQRI